MSDKLLDREWVNVLKKNSYLWYRHDDVYGITTYFAPYYKCLSTMDGIYITLYSDCASIGKFKPLTTNDDLPGVTTGWESWKGFATVNDVLMPTAGEEESIEATRQRAIDMLGLKFLETDDAFIHLLKDVLV